MSASAPADPARDLAAALDELERRLRRKRPPTRFEARAVLLALGALLEQGATAAEPRARLERLLEPVRDAWRTAVAEELSMACTEHVHAVDPRYLDHRRYDFEYTLAARERLEHRLRAAASLDLDPPEPLLERVASADALLAEALARRDERRRK